MANNPFFNYLTVNNGLSQNSITSVIQDSKGLIWIASYDGLNRFDGFSTLVKRHDSKNKNSLSENRILCMVERKDGRIWIGTDGGGINIYNPDDERFSHYNVQNGDIPDNNILSIISDRDDNIWIGTEKGLLRAKEHPDKSISFESVGGLEMVSKLLCDNRGNVWLVAANGLHIIPNSLSEGSNNQSGVIRVHAIQDPYVTTLFCDHSNNVWISTHNALYVVKDMQEYTDPLVMENLYSSVFKKETPVIRAIVEDLDHNIWIGTEQSGLIKLTVDKSGNLLGTSLYSTDTPFCNISDNSIRALFVDKTNVLWIGFHKKGVNYTDICGKRFNLLYKLCSPVMTELGYKSKFISSALYDSRDNIWLITEPEGTYVYNHKSKQLSYLNKFVNYNTVSSVVEAKSGDIWLGGYNCLYKIDKANADRNNFIVKEIFKPKDETGIIRTICEDENGDIWFGSLTGKGLYRYNPNSKQSLMYSFKDGIPSNKIFYLLADKKSPVIWVGTLDGGLVEVRYNKVNKGIEAETYTTGGNLSLNSNHVWNIYKDKKNKIWVGTDAGLNKIELNESGKIVSISSVDIPLLNGIKIMAITEDQDNNFWLNCSQGLYFFNPRTNEVQIYTYQDGLQSNTFNEASAITNDGWIYVGGINGVNYFHPSQIKKNPYASNVAIVNLRIHEKIIRPGERFGKKQILEKDINSTKELVLDYKSNNFMFEFVGIHYAITSKNQFEYQLEGFDGNWIHTGSNLRVAAYSNLPSGEYKFKVRSSNNDGVWSDNVKEIKITILPPPWKTVWAYLIYIICFSGLVYFIIHYLLTKQRLRNELYIERIEKDKMQELNEMKMSFFTNVTHEFRTPLVLILSPLKDLMSEIKKQNNYVQLRLQIINRNAQRLLSLINQTLDLRKISSETMTLLITQNNLHNQIETMIESFELLATDRDITIRLNDELIADSQWYDKYKIDKVLFNILSNAFKYTPQKGSIDISVSQDEHDGIYYAIISIKDTGRGIPQEEINRIFELFYQAKNSAIEGTGIGLSYVKSLLNIHRGDISVESKYGEGSCFTFSFAISKDAYDETEISETAEPDYDNQLVLPVIDDEIDNEISVEEDESSLAISDSMREKDKSKVILVVEDNIDLRMYMKDCLKKHYTILEASNGLSGLKIAKKEQPDLIITDIMMPLMDGLEFCRTLRSDIHTRHIPVFIHSVKSDEIALKEAMDSGAEDFISKPYNYAMLTKKIRNFFKTREHLISRTQAEVILEPADVDVPSSDEELIAKISRIIEYNLSNPEFGVEALADELGLSRMQLHRRIVMITGQQTSTLIRDIRLQRAAQLLKTGEKRISEVMWETGFNNHSRFNKYFKKKYGVNVKDYIKSSK